jgi:hypothetical protein
MHEGRGAPLFEYPRPESASVVDFVIMACIAGPAGGDPNWHVSGVHDAVSDFARDVMQTPRRHIFSPGMTRAIGEQKLAAARDGAIEFGTIADHVPVPTGHEIFVSDAAGLDFGKPPEQAALRAWRDWFPPPDPIDYCFRIKFLPGLMVAKNAGQLTKFLFRSLETGDLQGAIGPVHERRGRVHDGNRLTLRLLECKQKEQNFDHYALKANSIAFAWWAEVVELI